MTRADLDARRDDPVRVWRELTQAALDICRRLHTENLRLREQLRALRAERGATVAREGRAA